MIDKKTVHKINYVRNIANIFWNTNWLTRIDIFALYWCAICR